MEREAALATLRAGADLIQVYTGFAYRGHVLLQEILDALARNASQPEARMIADLIEQFQRDGAAHIPRLFGPERDGGAAGRHRLESRAHLSPRAKIASAASRSRPVRRGLLQLAGEPALPALHLRIRARGDGGASDAQPHRPPLSRSHAHQGARHAPTDAVASGPALLQHRRQAERELLDPGRPREPRLHSGIRRGLALAVPG